MDFYSTLKKGKR